MKKLLFALVLGLLLVFALATAATADNGPHGGFTATTDACGGCHRAHSAAYGSNALLVMDPQALCLSCHDGSGAATNVEDGVYNLAGSPYGSTEGTDGRSLFGGGFDNALMATAWNGALTGGAPAASRPTTSTHNIGTDGAIWGSGINNAPNGSMHLECTSCHTPHGRAGFTNLTTPTQVCNLTLLAANPVTEACSVSVSSYRLLRWRPVGSDGFTAPATSVNWSGGAFPVSTGTTTGWTVPDNFAANGHEWYTLNTTGAFAVGDYLPGNRSAATYTVRNPAAPGTITNGPAAIGVAYFCAQCHDRYFNNTRLRNHTDASAYCGHPLNGTTLVGTVTLAHQPDADGLAPYSHPVDPINCQPVVSATTGLITGWGDNTPRGDSTYMYAHSTGETRASMDGTVTAGTGTTQGRSCVTCHVSHGTAAQMTAFASDATLAAVGGADVNNSTLLITDNRSICLRCHTGDVNFTIAP